MPANSPLFFGGDAGEKARTGAASRETREAILKSARWEAALTAFARALFNLAKVDKLA
jgi:hypothetical protein